MSEQQFASVWDAIESPPEAAQSMKLRSSLMMALKSRQNGMSQAEAAKLFGVTQQRVSELADGRISLFDLDALVNMATAAGLRIELRVHADQVGAAREQPAR